MGNLDDLAVLIELNPLVRDADQLAPESALLVDWVERLDLDLMPRKALEVGQLHERPL